MTFLLHPQLQNDCIPVGKFDLCRVLLMNDSQFPWFILVPEVAEISEVYQLNRVQRGLLMEESCLLAEKLDAIYHADKINIAAIGNLVPQLHIHHVVRFRGDKAWPAPVWGKFPAIAYDTQDSEVTVRRITEAVNTSLRL
jgi:diadenosine tetraphosphate (Ap4A) HIT family hydrolase